MSRGSTIMTNTWWNTTTGRDLSCISMTLAIATSRNTRTHVVKFNTTTTVAFKTALVASAENHRSPADWQQVLLWCPDPAQLTGNKYYCRSQIQPSWSDPLSPETELDRPLTFDHMLSHIVTYCHIWTPIITYYHMSSHIITREEGGMKLRAHTSVCS